MKYFYCIRYICCDNCKILLKKENEKINSKIYTYKDCSSTILSTYTGEIRETAFFTRASAGRLAITRGTRHIGVMQCISTLLIRIFRKYLCKRIIRILYGASQTIRQPSKLREMSSAILTILLFSSSSRASEILSWRTSDGRRTVCEMLTEGVTP